MNDEGTYFAVAQAMAHGYRLYADVWENKPPALYLVYNAVYHLAGPSLLSIRVLTTLAVLAITVVAYLLARFYAGARAALMAGLLAGLLMGVPFLEGTTGNAEVFLALFSAAGVYSAVALERSALAGLCLGVAVLFKVVAGFDAAALAFWFLRWRRPLVLPYCLALAVVLAGAAALCWASGILRSALRDAVLYDLGYVGHGNGAHVPWLLLAKLLAVALLTLWLRSAPFPFLWLVYATAGALISGRFFGHYALQLVVPLCVVSALMVRERPRLATRVAVSLPVLFLTAAAVSALAGWAMTASGHGSILARRLEWYANFTRMALHLEPYSAYSSQVDDHVERNEALARRVERLPAGMLLVWGNTPWIYPLSSRLPATPYTSALRSPEVPGETAALRRALLEGRPRVVVVVWPAAPRLGPASTGLQHRYTLVARVSNATIYVAR